MTVESWSLLESVPLRPSPPSAGAPLVLNCMFRTGSSYLFEKLRTRTDLVGFQEPCHEIHLQQDNPLLTRSKANDRLRKTLRHPESDFAYFEEFAALKGTHQHHFLKEHPFDLFFLRKNETALELRDYLKTLTTSAGTKRPVLQFCRFFFRSEWLLKNISPLLVYLYRNPRDQWASYQVTPYFSATCGLVLNAANPPTEIRTLKERLQFREFHSDDITKEIQHFETQHTSADDGYFAFFTLWALSLLYNLRCSHFALSIDWLSDSATYRTSIERRLTDFGVAGLDLSDCKTRTHSRSNRELLNAEETEESVLQLLESSGATQTDLALVRMATSTAQRNGTSSAAAAAASDNLKVLRESLTQLHTELRISETDRAARAQQITELTQLAKAYEASATARATQVDQLTVLLLRAQEDATARSSQLEQLTALAQSLESNLASRQDELAELTCQLADRERSLSALSVQFAELTQLYKSHEASTSARASQVEQLTLLLLRAQADATARSAQIEQLTALAHSLGGDLTGPQHEHTEHETALATARVQLAELSQLAKAHESVAAARSSQVDQLTVLLQQAQADTAARSAQIDQLAALSSSLEAELAGRQQELAKHARQLAERDTTLSSTRVQLAELTQLTKAHETAAAARSSQVDHLTTLSRSLEANLASRQQEHAELTRQLAERETTLASTRIQLAELTAHAKIQETAATTRSAQVEQLSTLLQQAQVDTASRSAQVDQLTTLSRSLEAILASRQQEHAELTRQLTERETALASTRIQLAELTQQAKIQETAATTRSSQVEQLSALLQQAQADSAAHSAQIDQLTELTQSLSDDNRLQHVQVDTFAGWIREREHQYDDLAAAHLSAERTIALLRADLQTGHERHTILDSQFAHLETAFHALKSEILARDEECAKLPASRLARWLKSCRGAARTEPQQKPETAPTPPTESSAVRYTVGEHALRAQEALVQLGEARHETALLTKLLTLPPTPAREVTTPVLIPTGFLPAISEPEPAWHMEPLRSVASDQLVLCGWVEGAGTPDNPLSAIVLAIESGAQQALIQGNLLHINELPRGDQQRSDEPCAQPRMQFRLSLAPEQLEPRPWICRLILTTRNGSCLSTSPFALE